MQMYLPNVGMAILKTCVVNDTHRLQNILCVVHLFFDLSVYTLYIRQ